MCSSTARSAEPIAPQGCTRGEGRGEGRCPIWSALSTRQLLNTDRARKRPDASARYELCELRDASVAVGDRSEPRVGGVAALLLFRVERVGQAHHVARPHLEFEDRSV